MIGEKILLIPTVDLCRISGCQLSFAKQKDLRELWINGQNYRFLT